MSTEAERIAEVRKFLFPRRFWFGKPFHWTRPFGFGGDEYGQHTIWLSIPLIGSVVIAYKWCDCGELRGYECQFPGCPAFSMGGEHGDEPVLCIAHEPDFLRRFIAGEFEDDAA